MASLWGPSTTEIPWSRALLSISIYPGINRIRLHSPPPLSSSLLLSPVLFFSHKLYMTLLALISTSSAAAIAVSASSSAIAFAWRR